MNSPAQPAKRMSLLTVAYNVGDCIRVTDCIADKDIWGCDDSKSEPEATKTPVSAFASASTPVHIAPIWHRVAGFAAAAPLKWLLATWRKTCRTAAANAALPELVCLLGFLKPRVPALLKRDEAGVAPWVCLAVLGSTVCDPIIHDALTMDAVTALAATPPGVWLLCQQSQSKSRTLVHVCGSNAANPSAVCVKSHRRCQDVDVGLRVPFSIKWHVRPSSQTPGVMRLGFVAVVPKQAACLYWQILEAGRVVWANPIS